MNTNRFYLIDKPLDITSFDVIRNLRKKLNKRKMGHTGTLDPLASGALLVATGNYTKLIPYLEKDTKEYEVIINLDGVSASYDLGTEVEYIPDEKKEKYKKNIKINDIDKILKSHFLGEIEQIPPKYSALKIGGKKALDKVRLGEEFVMKKRKALIHSIEILNYKYPELKLKIKVSAGTYIRAIAYDLGEILGTGGYVSYLRRTKIAKINLNNSQKLSDFDENKVFDIKQLFQKDRFISLEEYTLSRVNQGLTQRVKLEIDAGDYFIELDGNITNIVNYEKGIIKPIKRIL